MKYEKPEVRLSEEAIRTIESHSKWMGLPDTIEGNPVYTTPAYEADE
jgi:hypothetical protein